MAGKDRNKNTDVGLQQALARDPYHFGFYEAVRQLECLYRDMPRLGRSVRPGDDAVRLGQAPSLRFAPSTLASFTSDADAAPRLREYFFGLFGPNGPLPLHLTEYARSRLRHARDPAMTDFMDLFHHRLLSLFYRAWADKEPTVQYDRPEQDRFALYVGSLLGIGEAGMKDRDAMPDVAKLHYAAHLACQHRHADGLAAILRGYFKMPVEIQDFIGEWLSIPTDSYCYLDASELTGQLGQSAVIGTRSWQCQHKFRIRIGPLGLSDYERLLPTGPSLKRLLAIVRNYIGFELNWELNLVLKREDVPAARPGVYGRLGWTSWLQGLDRPSDAADLRLDVEARLAKV